VFVLDLELLGLLPPRELCDPTYQYIQRNQARLISTSEPSPSACRHTSSVLTFRHSLSIKICS